MNGIADHGHYEGGSWKFRLSPSAYVDVALQKADFNGIGLILLALNVREVSSLGMTLSKL